MGNNEYNEIGYVYIPSFLDILTVSTISNYLENKITRGEWKPESESRPGSNDVTKYSYYADPLIEVLLKNSTEEVEKAVGEELLPTYSYVRIYQEGEELKKHTDRRSCEVSVTVNVAYKGDNSAIYMKYPGKDSNKYILNPGDAVIYQGCVVEHWRDKLQKDQLNVQFMLHYVKKYGNNSMFKFDTRKRLAESAAVRTL